jgi:hypothetical protein
MIMIAPGISPMKGVIEQRPKPTGRPAIVEEDRLKKIGKRAIRNYCDYLQTC